MIAISIVAACSVPEVPWHSSIVDDEDTVIAAMFGEPCAVQHSWLGILADASSA
jgi:hypothetical protein